MASAVERVLRPLVLSVVIGVFCIIASCMFAFRVLRAPRRSFKTLFGRSVDKRAVLLEQLRDPKYGTHSFVDVNGVRLHYVSRGTGSRLVLFLHGFPEFWYSWHKQMEFMAAQGFRCVAVDMRGYNESSKPLGINSYHRRKLIEDVRQLVHALGFQRCTLVAHDWGGIVAWDVVRKHADLVDRLVILNSPHPVLFQRNMNLKQLTKSYYIFFFATPWLPEALMKLSNFKFIALALGSGDPKSKISEADRQLYMAAFSRPGTATAALNYYRAMIPGMMGLDRQEGWERSKVMVPTLVLWGLDDVALGPQLLNGIEKVVDDVRVVRVEDCSHWIIIDQPDLVNREMLKFIKDE